MFAKFKSFFNGNVKAVVVSCAMAIMTAVSCFCVGAEGETTTTMRSAFETGLSTVSSEVLGYLALVVPVAVGILVAYIGVRKGFSFLRSLIGR